MKGVNKNEKRWMLLSGVSIIVALTGMVAYADESYTIATDTVFKPFEYLDEHGEFVGIDVDILAAIAQNQGFEYELNSLGWDASIAACQAKQADGMIAERIHYRGAKGKRLDFLRWLLFCHAVHGGQG